MQKGAARAVMYTDPVVPAILAPVYVYTSTTTNLTGVVVANATTVAVASGTSSPHHG